MKNILFLFLLAISFARAGDTSDAYALGSRITFTVTAVGDLPITFEWMLGTTKVGEGSELSISLSAVTAGTYTVRATNAFGSATSDKATIIVGIPPSKPAITITSTRPDQLSVTVPKGTNVIKK